MISELNSLTVTGVIATLVSVVFAGASFAISHRRKIHHLSGMHPQAVEPLSHSSPAGSREASPSRRAFASHPATGLASNPASPPLFKKLGTVGAENAAAEVSDKSDKLAWE